MLNTQILSKTQKTRTHYTCYNLLLICCAHRACDIVKWREGYMVGLAGTVYYCCMCLYITLVWKGIEVS